MPCSMFLMMHAACAHSYRMHISDVVDMRSMIGKVVASSRAVVHDVRENQTNKNE